MQYIQDVSQIFMLNTSYFIIIKIRSSTGYTIIIVSVWHGLESYINLSDVDSRKHLLVNMSC